MYTGSFQDFNGVRAADFILRDDHGAMLGVANNALNVTGTVNVANFPSTTSPAAAATDTFDAANTFANNAVVSLLVSNAARKQFAIYNNTNKTLAVGYANSVSNTAYSMPVASGGYYESKIGCYTGAIFAVAVGVPSSGSISITEFV